MITKAFKNLLACVLGSSGGSLSTGNLPAKNMGGNVRYLGFRNYFPGTVSQNVTFSASSGILVGTGNAAPTEDDYCLASQITSGMSATSPAATRSVDDNGNPYVEFVFVLSNTTGSDIVVSEIGYAQTLYCSSTEGSADSSTSTFLFDRTVLSTPVTVPANGSAAVKYTMKTVIS